MDDPLSSVTLERLVEALTNEKTLDLQLRSSFFLTYKRFATPLQLLNLLVERYKLREGGSNEVIFFCFLFFIFCICDVLGRFCMFVLTYFLFLFLSLFSLLQQLMARKVRVVSVFKYWMDEGISDILECPETLQAFTSFLNCLLFLLLLLSFFFFNPP